jgi:hypothetical protein
MPSTTNMRVTGGALGIFFVEIVVWKVGRFRIRRNEDVWSVVLILGPRLRPCLHWGMSSTYDSTPCIKWCQMERDGEVLKGPPVHNPSPLVPFLFLTPSPGDSGRSRPLSVTFEITRRRGDVPV